MTEKRFVDYFDKDHNYIVQDLQNEDEYQVGFVHCDEDVFLELVNNLAKENEQLKFQNSNLMKEVAEYSRNAKELKKENEQLKQFKSKVLELLDEKIKHYEHKPFSAPIGQPMSVNFDADMDRLARLSELQCLKKELQE